MKPAFTKGPWRVEPFIFDGKAVSVQVRGPATDDNARGLIVAETSFASDKAQRICYVETEAQAVANARAIAAFPDVLAALVAMLDHHSGVPVAADQQLLDAAEAAIAKVAMTEEQAAMRQAVRENPQCELLRELQLAHRIIANALAVMTPEQKSEWAARNILSGNDSEGTTRAHEREAVIAKAIGSAT